jgi:glycerol-3-phosphate O-acyltransferase / dihydroxyacetone phosphate acyltransferase
MTWLDERLFGWSQSAKRGTSAWLGADISRVATPDESEDEDNGDYDNVVGILYDDGLAKTRSRNSSFADLQRLRMSATPVKPWATSSALAPGNAEANVTEPHHRERRASLTEGIPVERIAQIPPQESFSEATHDLNEEAAHHFKSS